MAYSRGWSDSTPAGSRAANQIDDAIREKCVDIHERMDSTFANDWTADPVVAKPEIKGNVVGKRLYIPGHAFQVDSSFAAASAYASGAPFSGLQINSADPAIGGPLILPPASVVVITKIRWRVTNVDTAALSMTLYSVLFAVAATRVQEHTMAGALAADTIYDSGTIAVNTDNKMLYLAIDKTSGAAYKLWGVEITYDVRDCRFTV